MSLKSLFEQADLAHVYIYAPQYVSDVVQLILRGHTLSLPGAEGLQSSAEIQARDFTAQGFVFSQAWSHRNSFILLILEVSHSSRDPS